MVYVTVQPDSNRFLWENCVQVSRLIELGVDPANIFAIFSQGSRQLSVLEWPHLSKINVWTGPTPSFGYIPAIRAYLLSKLADNLPDKPVVYMDSDVYPIKLPSIEDIEGKMYASPSGHMLVSSVSVTDSSHPYDPLTEMCQMAGVDLKYAKGQTGGAQYILPSGVFTSGFWAEAGFVMTSVYDILQKHAVRQPHLIPWVADMWALQLMSWRLGLETISNEQMSVVHSPDPASQWDSSVWYHNSYLTSANKRTVNGNGEGGGVILFDKNEYREKLPFGEDMSYISSGTCSRIYADIVSKSGKYA